MLYDEKYQTMGADSKFFSVWIYCSWISSISVIKIYLPSKKKIKNRCVQTTDIARNVESVLCVLSLTGLYFMNTQEFFTRFYLRCKNVNRLSIL